MPLKVAVVMDPIGSIKIAKDSTFAMLLEAQRRGFLPYYVAPASLGVRDGQAIAPWPTAPSMRSEISLGV